MNLAKYRENLKSPLRPAALCLLIREGEILLAMKKRGFGEGRWNGVGGKPNEGESIKEAAIRESQEEIGVTLISFKEVAALNFYFPHNAEWDQQVHVFLVEKWEGEPKETEEMLPRWFKIEEIPFDCMWPDDIHWLPKVLNGATIKADFPFGPNDTLLEFKIREN